MPRKTGTARLQEFEIRITPTDQLPITKEHIIESDLNVADIIVMCEEGEPNGRPVLHYHMYVKAKISPSKMDQICSKLGRATREIKGNSVFSCKLAHDHTIGYIVKNKKLIYSNQNQTMIDHYFAQSDEYNRQKEASRKRASRKQEKTLADILKEVVVDNSSTASSITKDILQKYHENQIRFPSRTTMETMVMTLYYKEKPLEVEGFYTKNFLFI